MITFEGAQAVDEIAKRWALHDGRVVSVTVAAADGAVFSEIVCIPRAESPVFELRIRFSGVRRFELLWSDEQEFYLVTGYKALVQPSGAVYFSIDPYDDRVAEIDSRDASVIEARNIVAEFLMKTS